MRRICPGYPGGSCLTEIPSERGLCQFCKRTLTLALQRGIDERHDHVPPLRAKENR